MPIRRAGDEFTMTTIIDGFKLYPLPFRLVSPSYSTAIIGDIAGGLEYLEICTGTKII